MTRLPPEAREGLMRAWLAILRDHYPEVVWVPVAEKPQPVSATSTDDQLAVSA